jgi:hypothetical protein
MPSSLTQEQKEIVRQWVGGGMGLSEVQKGIGTEFGVTLTYLEARILMTELQVTPATVRTQETPALPPDASGRKTEPPEESGNAGDSADAEDWEGGEGGEATPPQAVRVSVDDLVTPGTLVSGKVTFSDGNSAQWYIDSMGRLGLGGVPRDYRPPEGDLPVFQKQLESLMRRAGF